MPKKKSHITVTDQFCGAGGSSQGVRNLSNKIGSGLEVQIALNHWKLAIETHATNFPDTQHDCTDISACDPRRYPSTDILITSPECTTHSPAGGNNHKALKKQMDLFETGTIDPATERSRATMWDVCRFAEYHKYNVIIVENVVEAKTRWALFEVWLTAMHTLGYNHKCVYLNSMHCHPTPQSRDRMYVVFWKKGNKAPMLDYTPLAHCTKCAKDVHAIQTWKNTSKQHGKYRQQYVYCCVTCTSIVEPYYYASFNCIDWSDIGTRIGDRKKPLKPATIKRVQFGREKYGNYPLVVVNYSPGYTKPVSDNLGSITCQDHHALLSPFLVNTLNGENDKFTLNKAPTDTRIKARSKSTLEPISTQTTINGTALVNPPFLIDLHKHGKARPMDREINTVPAGGIKSGLVTPESWTSFTAAYQNGSHCVKHISDELGTQVANDRSGLVTYKEPALEDCYYRMLKPTEIKIAMAFDRDYIILGKSKDQVKQCGNAVTPPAMEWLVQQCVESLN